jgi:hypothetical protein
VTRDSFKHSVQTFSGTINLVLKSSLFASGTAMILSCFDRKYECSSFPGIMLCTCYAFQTVQLKSKLVNPGTRPKRVRNLDVTRGFVVLFSKGWRRELGLNLRLNLPRSGCYKICRKKIIEDAKKFRFGSLNLFLAKSVCPYAANNHKHRSY